MWAERREHMLAVSRVNMQKAWTRNTGRRVSTAVRERLAEHSRKLWATSEHRAKMSRVASKTMKATNTKRAAGAYPEWDKRISTVMSKRMFAAWRSGSMTGLTHMRHGCFRSKLEKTFAGIIKKNGMTWLYEPHTFPVVMDDKIRSYTPDFYIVELDQWIEVKGFWRDQESHDKVLAFMQQYPRLKFTVLLGAKLEHHLGDAWPLVISRSHSHN